MTIRAFFILGLATATLAMPCTTAQAQVTGYSRSGNHITVSTSPQGDYKSPRHPNVITLRPPQPPAPARKPRVYKGPVPPGMENFAPSYNPLSREEQVAEMVAKLPPPDRVINEATCGRLNSAVARYRDQTEPKRLTVQRAAFLAAYKRTKDNRAANQEAQAVARKTVPGFTLAMANKIIGQPAVEFVPLSFDARLDEEFRFQSKGVSAAERARLQEMMTRQKTRHKEMEARMEAMHKAFEARIAQKRGRPLPSTPSQRSKPKEYLWWSADRRSVIRARFHDGEIQGASITRSTEPLLPFRL